MIIQFEKLYHLDSKSKVRVWWMEQEDGYDLVTGTQKKQEIIILNPVHALVLKKVIYVNDIGLNK